MDDETDSAFENVRQSAENLCTIAAQDFPPTETIVGADTSKKYVYYDPSYDSVNNIVTFKKRVTKTGKKGGLTTGKGSELFSNRYVRLIIIF